MQDDVVSKYKSLIKVCNLINTLYDDKESLITTIVDSAASVLGGDAASLLLFDKKRENLHFEVATGEKSSVIKQFTLRKGEGIAGWVALHGEPVLVNNASDDDRFDTDLAKAIGYPVSSILCVPILYNNEVLGVLEILNKADSIPFTADDQELASTFCSIIGVSISNAASFSTIQNQLETMQHDAAVEDEYQMIGSHPTLLELMTLAERVAQSDASVLITGESGTGKELLARYVHRHSRRSSEKFVAINCAALPDNLIENELFGHKKGAFTDATDDYDGKFLHANGGTIFLDEIGELGLHIQAKLLRVLQFKTFEPIGGSVSLTTDVKIITATNRDLAAMVRDRQFREDLFYRLNVVPLRIPALRERKEDIEMLANHFIKMYNRKHEREISGLQSDALSILHGYQWPGNIRELQNVIERAFIHCTGTVIKKDDIVLHDEAGTSDMEDYEVDLKTAVNDFKKDFIVRALERHGWNQTKTAETLQIQRTYLSRLIKELDINKL
jgi:Nif-specific regulatory protein